MRQYLWWIGLIGGVAFAQESPPHGAFVYPAGGQQGAVVELTVGGQFLDGASQAIFARDGVQAEVTGFVKPLPATGMEALRARIREIEQKHSNAPRANMSGAAPAIPWTPEDRQLVDSMRHELDQFTRLRSAPPLSQWVRLTVHIAPDAVPGNHELRLLTNRGLTNPLIFIVGTLPEQSRAPGFVPPPLSAGGGLPLSPQAHAAQPENAQPVVLPVVLNGQMMPGAVHRYRFHARKGQQIVVAAKTRSLIPYMADAVPGWFQAALALTDSSGRQLGAADHFRFSQEPVLAVTIPADGEYTLAVRDVINRGREDFIYRIAVGEIPFVSSLFPLGESVGEATRIMLGGWNLERKFLLPATGEAGVIPFRADKTEQYAPEIAYRVGTLREQTVRDNSADLRHARPIALPVVINGRLAHSGASACFAFRAESGEDIVADIEARRLGSPLDSTLTLYDSRGKRLSFNDDGDDKGSVFLTHHADSHLGYHITANGTYHVCVADSQRNGGADYGYRLRVSHPLPDYEVRMFPSAVNLRAGRTVPVTVQVIRRDGFAGEVRLHIADGPGDLRLSGGLIPSGVDTVRIGLTAPPEAFATPQHLALEAEAEIGGMVVRHPVAPADDSIQAFAWHEPMPAEQGLIWVVGKERRKPMWKMDDATLQLPAGGSVELALQAETQAPPLTLTLNDPPAGIRIASVEQTGNALRVVVQADRTVNPKLAGNLIMDASTPNKAGKRVLLESLPALPFRVLAPAP